MKHHLLLFVITIGLFTSCRKYDVSLPEQPLASEVSAGIANTWMEQYRQLVKTQGLNPPQASRIYAYAGIAVYEAVLPGLPGNQSTQGKVPLLNNLPQAHLFGKLDYEVSVNEAMYKLAKTAFINLSASNILSIDALYKLNNDALINRVHGPVYESSKEFGGMVATAILQRVAKDGFAETRTMSYTVPNRTLNPAFWAPTNAVLSPLEPHWGKIKCFAMISADECEEPQTINFDQAPGSAFYAQAMEVYNVSQNLTQAQKDIALWWADGAGTATPPGHWIAIAIQLAKDKNLSLGKAAEMYALLNIALGDAFISCWDAKFKYNLLRPQTYIRDYIPNGNSWTSFIGTPPFPEYPSGHSVSSGAAAEILTHIFGNIPFTDNANIGMGLQARSYSSFYEAAEEAAMSRLYGGIHFREGNEKGVRQGKILGQVVVRNIKLR